MEMRARWENQLLALAGNAPHPSTRPMFSYWADDASLHMAYAHAEKITRKNSKSFYLASQLLPEEKRLSIRALYAFCRTVDDIVDENTVDDREEHLDYWRQISKGVSTPKGDLVAVAWANTLARYHIPHQYAQQLIDGVHRDMIQTRYQTFEDLTRYCYGVASTVGLMSMYIVGYESNDAVPYAIKLGVALQMTNILRDVGEDFRNGRVYLPREELVRYGIREKDLSSGLVTEAWRSFMKFQIERTHQLYEEAWPGIKMLAREGQLAIGAAAILYQGILDAIEANDYDVFTLRAHIGLIEKMKRLHHLRLKL